MKQNQETPESGYIRKAGAAIEAMQKQAKAHQLLEAATRLHKKPGQKAEIIYSLREYERLLNTPGVKITDRVIHLLDNGMKAFVVYEVGESEQQKPLPVESERQNVDPDWDKKDGDGFYCEKAVGIRTLRVEQEPGERDQVSIKKFILIEGKRQLIQHVKMAPNEIPVLIELLQFAQNNLQP
jgi:hypothetical protein